MIKLTLDKYLSKINMTRYELAKITDIRYHIIDKYYKNKVVRYDSFVLNKICEAIECDLSDIMEYSKD